MPRPMRDMLRHVSGRTSLHMPAAQGRAPFRTFDPYRLDTTELPITDDLYHPVGAIAQAEELAARSAGAMATLLLHGGSTAGVHAMLLYACGRGGQLVLPRNAHLSCLNLCALAGIEPVFAQPSQTPEGRIYTTAKAYADALDAHPKAAAFALHGDYYGLMSDLSAIAQETHARGRLLLCDDAHGAYFNWRKDIPNAGACGADLFVQSAHKTLPALTPGAWLHAMPGVDAFRLRALLRVVQTSSPSFIIMLSLDEARAWMDRDGRNACEKLLVGVERFYKNAARLGYTDGQNQPPLGMRYDRLRLVLYAPQGGETLQAQLAALGLDVEMSDIDHIVCILPLKQGAKRLAQLLRALRYIGKAGVPRVALNTACPQLTPTQWPPRRMPLAEAAFAPEEAVPLQQALGRISTASVGRYPPGVAWLTAGDEITLEIISLLEATPQDRLFGLTQSGLLRCVRLSQ